MMETVREDATRRVTQAVVMTLQVFKSKNATVEEREAALAMERRLLQDEPRQSEPKEGGGQKIRDTQVSGKPANTETKVYGCLYLSFFVLCTRLLGGRWEIRLSEGSSGESSCQAFRL